MFDCHMHTKFSTDSLMDPSIACKTAIGLGLDGIVFTDHLDYDYPEEEFVLNIDDYFSEMEAVKSLYSNKLKILHGVEVGIQPHVLEDSLKVVTSYPFDYVLAAVHIIDGFDPYMREYYKGKTKHEAYELYLQKIYTMIKTFKSFDMVAHFEYIIRYACYDDRMLRYAEHKDILDAILSELVSQGRGFELNTGTYRKNPPDIEYDFEVLRRYRQLGGELICLGSDAHKPENIGVRFTYYAQMLRDAGFKYTVHFENRKPVFDPL